MFELRFFMNDEVVSEVFETEKELNEFINNYEVEVFDIKEK